MTYEETLNQKLQQEYPETLENYQELRTAFVNGINFAHKYYPTSPDCPVREWHNLIDDPTDLPDVNKVCRLIFSDGTKGIGSMIYKIHKVTQTQEPGSLNGSHTPAVQPGLPNQDPWSISGGDSGDDPGTTPTGGDDGGDNSGNDPSDNPTDPTTGGQTSDDQNTNEQIVQTKVWTVRYRSDIVAWSYYIMNKINGNYV